jgi:hypothetical protein
VVQVKQVGGGEIVALEKLGLHISQKARDRHPEVIPHQEQALHAAAVALPQCLNQLGAVVLL